MAMNREMKRRLQKQGELGSDGEPVRKQRQTQRGPAPRAAEKDARLFSRQGLREVRGELRKVAWPTRSETINYSIIVLVALVFMTVLIALVDWVFSNAVLKLFNVS
jgi:preprotein translocase subunit SecE